MSEGSVMVDGVNPDPDDLDETSADEDQSESDETEESSDSQNINNQDESQGEEGEQLTEKGTKLDPNPMSALNQQLANERARVRQYESFLKDPNALKEYINKLEKQGQSQDSQPDQPPVDPSKIETVEDLQAYAKWLGQSVEKTRKDLETRLSSVNQQTQAQAVANKVSDEIAAVRDQYPELRPKLPDGQDNPNYNKDLDDTIGELYTMADFDQKTGNFRGQVSLVQIAKRVMSGATSAKKRGSQEAQRIVRDRTSGRAISGASEESRADTSKMSAEEFIAHQMKQASRRNT